MTDFQFETEVDVRFRDVDVAGHVNNAVYGTYVEQGRIEYLRELFGDALAEGGPVLAHLEIDFERPVQLGTDAVTVAVRATEVGTSSVRMAYELRAEGDVVATAETVLVTTDGDGPVPMPEEWRETLTEFEGL